MKKNKKQIKLKLFKRNKIKEEKKLLLQNKEIH